MGRVVVFGSINLDTVLEVPHIAAPGETVGGFGLETFPGGKGGNQALAAHNAGADVCLVGKVGMDAAGQQMIDFYRGEGLPIDGIGNSELPTGAAFIQVERDGGENAIVVVAGANGDFTVADADAVEIAPDDVIVAMFEVPIAVNEALFSRARGIGAQTVLNPSPAHPCPPGLFASTTHLVLNETELAVLSGHPISETSSDGFIAAAVSALEAPAGMVVVVTRGPGGARGFAAGDVIPMPGRRVDAVDTTGAGDCFTGVYAARLAAGDDVETAMIYANAAAAISVTRPGAATSLPTHAEIESLLRRKWS
ncbi:MAG: ribokinase [Rhodospirillales bacterium]